MVSSGNTSRTALVAVFGIVMAMAATFTAAQFPSSDTACTRHYTVVDGDTCDKIGQKTMTSTYQIMSFNLPKAGSDCYTLEIGADLCLGRYGNDCQLVHEAQGSDSCHSIARRYNITESLLKNNNPLLNCDVVYDGLMLCVAPGIIRPPSDRSLNLTAQAEVNQQGASSASVAAAATQTSSSTAKAAKGHVQAAKANLHSHHHGHHKNAAKHYQQQKAAEAAAAAKKAQEEQDAKKQDDAAAAPAAPAPPAESATPDTPPTENAPADNGSDEKNLKGVLGGKPIVVVGDPNNPVLVE